MAGAARAMEALKPPLKWAGGKRWLVPRLASVWSAQGSRRLVEPFCGGLAVCLGLAPHKALVNDINPHSINFFRCLKDGLLIDLVMENDRELYYAHRERFNALIASGRPDGTEAASLFYYLNRTGYNGLCRFNRKGLFNVPFGRYKSINYQRDFGAYQRTLSRWELRHGDYADLRLRKSDFVYADPPYDVEFTSYSAHRFDWAEQVRLARWLSHHRGPVVLSNQATDRIITLYRELGFELRYTFAPRYISRDGNRTPAVEVLALRNLAACAVPDTFEHRPHR